VEEVAGWWPVLAQRHLFRRGRASPASYEFRRSRPLCLACSPAEHPPGHVSSVSLSFQYTEHRPLFPALEPGSKSGLCLIL
jgi:hypothetical protein